MQIRQRQRSKYGGDEQARTVRVKSCENKQAGVSIAFERLRVQQAPRTHKKIVDGHDQTPRRRMRARQVLANLIRDFALE